MLLASSRFAIPFWLSLVLLGCGTHHLGVLGHPFEMARRRFNGMGVPMLIIAIKEYLQGENAYDPSVPNKCVILFGASNTGAGCKTFVQCENSDRRGDDAGEWQACFEGGRQYFSHPDVGDYSITFTKAGGGEDGLHSPVLQLADYNDWEPFVLDDIIEAQGGLSSSEGNLCKKKKSMTGSSWTCGVPKKGGGAAFGISIIGQDSDQPGYEPGWCTAHVNQYQKNQLGTGNNYAFDVILKDNDGNQIGHIQHVEVDEGGHLSVTSQLPFTFDISVGAVDSDPVTFAYAGQSWVCDGKDKSWHACTLAKGRSKGYENGDREGDMGFTCDAA
ncbi:hypothetical protein FSARC_3564 [Fusarium sarcochroum]|uniref:Uncharacterized protein n=1 Tax=Fusarium sarcochroum TaxID=1208366 RepID=A0A8H4U488_9HYPO|nr:hypothetical protein FSARC_3564 [Fusarium sarcochroum]